MEKTVYALMICRAARNGRLICFPGGMILKQAIIDIGSNSMRLTLYETEGRSFKILFREKRMVGLAGYVEKGTLSPEGMECAAGVLLDFQRTLSSLGIGQTVVFATASLRNISNTEQALDALRSATGYQVEVLSGQEEALLGYGGAMEEFRLSSGAFLDIGGASTEIVVFDGGKARQAVSFPVGSLSLYRECVKKILPGEGSVKRMEKAISSKIPQESPLFPERQPLLVGVGGTCRAVRKLAKTLYKLPKDSRRVSARQVEGLCGLLCQGGRRASDLVLKLEPDRIHTLVPGILILRHILRLFQSDALVVSKYGVREGYLCRKILPQQIPDTPKTGN